MTTPHDMEYHWLYMAYQSKVRGVTYTLKLYGIEPPARDWGAPTTIGYLQRGTRRNKGWFVQNRYSNFVTTLPNELTADEARNTARMILLSLKESQ